MYSGHTFFLVLKRFRGWQLNMETRHAARRMMNLTFLRRSPLIFRISYFCQNGNLWIFHWAAKTLAFKKGLPWLELWCILKWIQTRLKMAFIDGRETIQFRIKLFNYQTKTAKKMSWTVFAQPNYADFLASNSPGPATMVKTLLWRCWIFSSKLDLEQASNSLGWK